MSHTLVGKAVPVHLRYAGFRSLCRQSAGLLAGPGMPWENFCFCLFCFFFALTVSPLLGIPDPQFLCHICQGMHVPCRHSGRHI